MASVFASAGAAGLLAAAVVLVDGRPGAALRLSRRLYNGACGASVANLRGVFDGEFASTSASAITCWRN